jgi:hypothetical protein
LSAQAKTLASRIDIYVMNGGTDNGSKDITSMPKTPLYSSEEELNPKRNLYLGCPAKIDAL